MSLLGVQLTLLIGQTVPVPAPPTLIEALDEVKVEHTDEGHSGFQVTFRAGRATTDLIDYPFLASPLLRPCSRVVLVVTFRGMPEVLIDGVITNQQLQPGREPGTSTLTITGEDVSIMMEMEEKSVEHPAQPELVIVNKIIASYARYGLIPKVIPPPSVDVPIPTERTPVQQDTDLQFLKDMAGRFGYVFYVTPGPVPTTSTAYWGPPERIGIPQRALTVNMGPDTNVIGDPDFQYDALAPEFVEGQVQDRQTNQTVPVQTVASTRVPIVTQPAWATQGCVRKRRSRESGLNIVQALARAQGQTDASTDRTIKVSGQLDALVYEGLLKPHALVGLRGVGYSYDGFYYVKRVTHSIRIGEYTQNFELEREGLGAISPVIPA